MEELLYSKLVKEVSAECSVSEELCKKIIQASTRKIVEGVGSGRKVHFGHLGMFYPLHRKSQKYFKGTTTPRCIIKFRPTRLIRNLVKNYGKEKN